MQNAVSQRTGAALGAVICSIFGTVWMLLGVVFSGRAQPFAFALAVVPGIVLLLLAIRLLRALRGLSDPAGGAERAAAVMKLSGWVLAAEWVLGLTGVMVCVRLRRYDLIPQVLGAIVGLHFLPLARIFRIPLYYWTGSLMVLVCSLSLLLSRGYGRNIVACGGLGLVLWLSGVAMLRRASPGLIIT